MSFEKKKNEYYPYELQTAWKIRAGITYYHFCIPLPLIVKTAVLVSLDLKLAALHE